MKPIVVVGAGITGCVTALELARRGHKVVLIEKDSRVGGLAKTFRHEAIPPISLARHSTRRATVLLSSAPGDGAATPPGNPSFRPHNKVYLQYPRTFAGCTSGPGYPRRPPRGTSPASRGQTLRHGFNETSARAGPGPGRIRPGSVGTHGPSCLDHRSQRR